MKYCSVCERRYEDEMKLCGVDGTPLEPMNEQRSKQDRYIGRTICGRYQIIEKLGEGGMGTVYLAEQLSMARKVAIKLLQGNYANDDDFIGRFRREARLAASLNHPFIVTIYDFDQADDRTLFFAMEYVNGRKLSDVIRSDGPLSIARAVRLGAQIAEGLGSAHQAGVIHRDIKPDNILVVGEGDVEAIKLMDFGIARLRDSGAMTRLTRPDMIMGTPAYMAPEQAEGAEVSDKTDIYALGIVLYEMLSGLVPFKASTPGAVLIKQIRERPLALRNLRREVPLSIERIVMRALEKQPLKRQQGMYEVFEALKEAKAGVVESRMARTIAVTLPLQRSLAEKLRLIENNRIRTALVSVLLALGLGFILYSLIVFSDSRLRVQKNFVSLILEGEKEKLRPQERVQLRALGTFSDSSKKEIGDGLEWHSSNDSVATVDSKGQVEARKEGTAGITARYNGLTSPPATVVVKQVPQATGDLSRNLQDHLKRAGVHRDRGDYRMALMELGKAKTLDPNNKIVSTEIERTTNACLAEQRLGIVSSCE